MDPTEDFVPRWNKISGNRPRLDEPWLPAILHEGGLKPLKTLTSRHFTVDLGHGEEDGEGAAAGGDEEAGAAAAVVALDGDTDCTDGNIEDAEGPPPPPREEKEEEKKEEEEEEEEGPPPPPRRAAPAGPASLLEDALGLSAADGTPAAV